MNNLKMHEYGYLWDGMIPLTPQRARELFEHRVIFCMHKDNTETEVRRIEWIDEEHLYGYERPKKETELIGIARCRLKEIRDALPTEKECPEDARDCGRIDGEYNTWIQILNILGVEAIHKKQIILINYPKEN